MPFTPSGLVGHGVTVWPRVSDGHVGRRRHEVLGERGRLQVAVGVVDRLLEQRLGEALDDAAVHLAVDDQRVDLVAAVVDGDVLQHVDVAGLGVDLDDADVRAEGPREVGRVVGDVGLEVRLQPVGQVVRGEGLEGDRRQRQRLVRRALDGERATDELEVVLGGLELVGGDLAGLVDHLVAGHGDGHAADGQRARAVGVEARAGRSPCRSAARRRRRGHAELVGDDHRTTTSRGPGRAVSAR